MKIFIDAGHGGVGSNGDSGAIGQNGTYESHINLEVSNLLGKLLSNGRAQKVGYTRTIGQGCRAVRTCEKGE